MPVITLDTRDPGLREEIHKFLLSVEQQGLSPNRAASRLINLLSTYAHLSRNEVTPEEVNAYANSLITWISNTIKSKDAKSIEAIRSLWDDEPWEEIQTKILTDGSTWYVWWMDGLRKYIAIDRGWLPKETKS